MFQDVAAYVGLFLAIRSGDWDLRTACIKQTASVFTAFDHANDCKLISQHLADLLCMPQSILTMFQQGVFVVSMRGRLYSVDWTRDWTVGLDCGTGLMQRKLRHRYKTRGTCPCLISMVALIASSD